MSENFEVKAKKNFNSLWNLYFIIFFIIGIFPVNLGNFLKYLPGTTEFGLGVRIAIVLAVNTISIIFFGYYGDKISEKFSRKKVFIFANLIWVIASGLITFSVNFTSFLIFSVIFAIGQGAFLPLGFSIIGDFFPPKKRGKKYGAMSIGMILGNGAGIIFGGLLGNYVGSIGWRLTYGLCFFLGLLAITKYAFSGFNPERGRAEPELRDFNGEFKIDYKITYSNLAQLFKKKTITILLISVIFSSIGNLSLSNWAIFYLSSKIVGDVDTVLLATTLYVITGIGMLPGSIIGGRLGDSYYSKGKIKGRIIITIIGIVIGVPCLLGFYLVPFFTTTPLEILFSWMFLFLLGFFGMFFTSFNIGNQYAIYSEVCVPELRSTVNALSGVMMNIGGIIGNLYLSSLIESNISLLSFGIFIVLLFWLFSSFFWVISIFYYPKESNLLREEMVNRRIELEKQAE